MTYPEAIQFLYNLQTFGTKLGLENTFRLAGLTGKPQDKLRFIHVAGTNGKGSTSAMLESIYRHAGLKVGLFTSPHLVSFAERIQIDRQLISETDIIRLVSHMQVLLKNFERASHPTFFEVVAVMALQYFAENKCDLVIWEAGMGGRLDATNIVCPLASVITNIGLDHQAWLGDTTEKIAFEKAGIIKPGKPVITGTTDPAALKVISEAARAQGSALTTVSAEDVRKGVLAEVRLPLIGEHQRLNAAVTVAAVGALHSSIPVSEHQLRAGLETVSWAGRLQLFRINERQSILVDGAHNVAGAEVLRETIKSHFDDTEPAMILGVLGDKAWNPICATLAPMAKTIVVVPVKSQRTAQPDELKEACLRTNPNARCSTAPSVAEALKKLAGERFVIITGSLYLVGEALELLERSAARGERGLNEWSGSPPASLRSDTRA